MDRTPELEPSARALSPQDRRAEIHSRHVDLLRQIPKQLDVVTDNEIRILQRISEFYGYDWSPHVLYDESQAASKRHRKTMSLTVRDEHGDTARSIQVKVWVRKSERSLEFDGIRASIVPDFDATAAHLVAARLTALAERALTRIS